MKRSLFILVCSVLCMSLVSCNKDDDNVLVPDTPTDKLFKDNTGLLLDAEGISSVGFYCIEKHPAVPTGVWFDYYPKTKTFSDYSEMAFCQWLHEPNGASYWENTIENYSIFDQRLWDYYKSKTSFIVDAMEKYYKETPEEEAMRTAEWPDLCSAYINGEITLTCDKTLWGETPGTNLSKYFRRYGFLPCLVVGVESPRLPYKFGEMPEAMNELLPQEAWLYYKTYWDFQTPPSEKYDELTFTLTMPVLMEHCRKIVYYQYMGMPLDSKYSDQTFTASCTIKFDWE